MQLKPQDYSRDSEYRPPARWYRRVNPIGVVLVRLGLAPKGVVVLEVPGRSTGAIRRTPLLTTSLDGSDYLVALAGESHWVRNVRANHGRATVIRRTPRPSRLVEVPPSERAAVISEYLSRDKNGNQAKYYFGLAPNPSIADIGPVVDRYPVFRIDPLGEDE